MLAHKRTWARSPAQFAREYQERLPATTDQALHSANLLHRDLKPANILVTRAGRVVVLDFGLVKDFQPLTTAQSLTLAGTPAYMAPEQGLSETSEQSDWYSVGVILFQSLTGKLPHTGHFAELIAKKASEPAPRPRDINEHIPEDLDEICQTLLSRRPEYVDQRKRLATVLGTM